MTITRADVADLKPGDVVELTGEAWPAGTILRGPVYEEQGFLYVGGTTCLRRGNGEPTSAVATLTVISRAPRPLYVNSDKTEPDPGDVVRDADSIEDETVWMFTDPTDPPEAWTTPLEGFWRSRSDLPARLRLLVDGRTGQVVQ